MPVAPRGAQHRHGVRAGQVQQVHRALRCAGRPRSGARWRCSPTPRGREARKLGVVPPVRRRGALDRRRVLRVDDHLGAVGAPARPGTPRAARPTSGGNSSTPESAMKHLNPKTPASCSPRRSSMLPGIGAAPEPDVDVAACPRAAFALDLQRLDGAGRREAVERHVEDGRDAAGRRGAGGRREALPLGAAGLVDVHVGVDEAGQQHLVVGQVDGLRPPRSSCDSSGSIATTTPSRTATQRGTSPARVITRRAAHHQVEVGHARRPPALPAR